MIEYQGDDALAFVLSLNLHRRHLNESQRAMVAARIANIGNGGDRRSDQSANWPTDRATPVSQPMAAALLNVGERSIRRAQDVQRTGIPELASAVERGEVSVSAAATVARLEPEVQTAVVEAHQDSLGTHAARSLPSFVLFSL